MLDAVIHPDDDVIDISEVRFLDGRAAAVINDELTRRRGAGQPLVLSGACGLVRRVWALCGFDAELLAS